jgi:quinol monooxygenase YgiN
MHTLLGFVIGAMLMGAQASTDTTFYSVAYVEVAPASKGTVVNAFKQYREASRKDEGFQRAELFEQPGWPGHFVIMETWATPKAFETHTNATNTKEWRSKLDPIRLSDYDQRPYKTLSVMTPASVNDRATYVISHVDIGGQGTNAADLLKRLAEASRKEKGNLRFDVVQHTMRANHFTVIEAWQNEKALEEHSASASTKQYREGIAPIAGSPLDQRIFKSLE